MKILFYDTKSYDKESFEKQLANFFCLRYNVSGQFHEKRGAGESRLRGDVIPFRPGT